MANPLRAICADITTLEADSFVNAANKSLLSGRGVRGTIQRAAGPKFAQTSIYGYPFELAANVAIDSVRTAMAGLSSVI